MDQQIRNNIKCHICPGVAIGVFDNKWICGRCLLKIEDKLKQEKRKYYDLIETEIRRENAEK